jgi:tRNA(Ile)-lysidine synthase
MALAALCSEIQQTPIENMVAGLHSSLDKSTAAVLRDLRFQAFVVDHGVREGSEAEAKSVATVLEERGV